MDNVSVPLSKLSSSIHQSTVEINRTPIRGSPLRTNSSHTTPLRANSSHSSPLRASKMTNTSPLRQRGIKLAGSLGNGNNNTNTFNSDLHEDTENSLLQSQYADMCAKYASLSIENKHIHDELLKKANYIEDLELRLLLTERALRQLEIDHQQALDAHEEDIACYRHSLEDLQRQTLHRLEQANQDILHSLALYQSADEKYTKLQRSYKALQSNLELEHNLKILLIDQIEHLTKERDILLNQVDPNLSSVSVSGSDRDSLIYQSLRLKRHLLGNSPIHLDQNPLGISADGHVLSAGAQTISELAPHQDYDSDGSIHASHNLSSFVENPSESNFTASSPIKNASHSSIEVSQNFHFPASDIVTPPTEFPTPGMLIPSLSHSSNNKNYNKPRSRRSLPARIETQASLHPDDNFVPSPLKLTRPNSTCLEGDLSLSNSASESHRKKRSSHPKPYHSRMNSLDILPIKVEFELEEQQQQHQQQPRSSSSPDRNYLRNLDSVIEGEVLDDGRDLAFMKLNGFTEPSNKRDSLLTTSSKRSSLLTDFNILSGDITKQEITKLKFELQSLKLHNEKLLSYIGFELQKQKKNIKKLSSKQRLRPSSVEYSDAKLIEKLKDVLIHKKRVLRLVSINPILSTKYDSNGQLLPFAAGIRLLAPNGAIGSVGSTESVENVGNVDEVDEFIFRSLFINSLKGDCDDYGFMNHQQKHNLRILSDLDQKYLHETDEKLPKKYKSQTFRTDRDRSDDDSEYSDLLDEQDFIEEEDEDGGNLNGIVLRNPEDWETTSEQSSSGSDVNYSQLNRFNQMKYIVLGKEHMKRQKKRKDEVLIDENLKYKFLTLVVGIVIVGFRFTSQTHLQLQGS